MNIATWLQNHPQNGELILSRVLGQDPTFFLLHPDHSLNPNQLARASQLANRHSKGEPLAQLFGYQDFYGRRFHITKDVLIPRPESEIIIDLAKSLQPATILDVGTGSGCLAITLKLELPSAQVTASDISASALKIAIKNSQQHAATINFQISDLLDQFSSQDFDLIVANLPYVDQSWPWLDHRALQYEPEVALFADDKGLSLIKKLINQAQNHTRHLLIEADPIQHADIKKYALGLDLEHIKTAGYILLFRVLP